MFHLEQAVAAWRKHMIAQGIKSARILDELESHLRDQIDAQTGTGVPLAEAFKIATGRIGKGPALKAEFAKLSSRQTRLPQLFRIGCFVSAPFMIATSAWVLLDSEIPGRLVTFFFISGLGVYLGSLPFWYRFLPNPCHRTIGIAIKAMTFFMACFPVLALLEASGVIHVPGNESTTMLGWSLLMAHVGTIFAYMCLDLERGVGWGLLDCPAHDKFTELAQRGIEIAYDEAAALGHHYVGTEDLLLGMVSCESGSLMDVLRKYNTDPEMIRAEIAKVVGTGVLRKSARDIPFTPRAKKALALAMKEAHAMGHSLISGEHVFLGLVMENEGVAAIVLRKLGIDAAQLRRDIVDGLGPGGDGGPLPVVA